MPARANRSTAVAHQAVVVAQANYWLAKVEDACVRSGCDPAYCRVRDSLSRSVAAEQAELRRLRNYALGHSRPGVAA